MTGYQWIDEQELFNDLVAEALTAERIAVDTEFHRGADLLAESCSCADCNSQTTYFLSIL